MERDEFQLFNPWWLIKEAINDDSTILEFEKQKLKYYHPFFLKFPQNEDAILTLRGPRQVGKSTLLKLIIRRLILKEKITPRNVLFYPADRVSDFNELFQILLSYIESLRAENNNRSFIFVDEVSNVAGWQRSVKQLADMGKLKNITLCLTGSNAIDLRVNSERMPGRKGKLTDTEIEILPLTFGEFTSLIKPEWQSQTEGFFLSRLPELQKTFREYLTCGGFPKSINEFYQEKIIPSYVFKTYRAWVFGDLMKAGKNEETALNLIKRLFAHLGSTFSFYEIAEKAGINSHMTAIDYLDLLEKMFVIFKLPMFSIDERKSYMQKNKKAYFFDPLIYNTLRVETESYLDEAFNYVTREILTTKNFPKLAENAVALHLKRASQKLYFGRFGKQEIDFVSLNKGKYSFFEVKYQNEVKIADFHDFSTCFPDEKLTVLTKNQSAIYGKIHFTPLSLFLLSQ